MRAGRADAPASARPPTDPAARHAVATAVECAVVYVGCVPRGGSSGGDGESSWTCLTFGTAGAGERLLLAERRSVAACNLEPTHVVGQHNVLHTACDVQRDGNQ